MAKYEAKFHVHHTPLEEGSQAILLIAAGFLLLYLFGALLYADLSSFSLNTFIHPVMKNQNSYLFFWLIKSTHLFLISALLVALPCLSNKTYYSFISFGGFIIAFIAGYLFGPVKNPVHPGNTNNGWLIWCCIFGLSILIGAIVQLFKDKKTGK